MNNIITITELLLFAIGLSLVINATHIAFQDGMALNWLYKWFEKVFRNRRIVSKYRNNEGLLYIAKPIYACASCMPSIWSIPLYFILVAWKVFIIVIFAIVISTILRDKIFE
jgi:hypothetical protein